MSKIKTTDQRFVNIEKKIGLFVLIVGIGIVAAIVFIGVQQDVFSSKKSVYFVADSGKDLKDGLFVTLSGFKIGKVKRVFLDDISKVKVELSINSDYMKWIKTDSKAKLTKELPIGEGIIEILPGSPDSGAIAENGVIEFAKEQWFSAMTKDIEPFPISIKDIPAMTKLFQEIKDEIDPMLPDLKLTLANLSKLTNSTVLLEGEGVLKNANKSFNDVVSITSQLADKMPAIIDKLDSSLAGTDKLMESFEIVSSNILPQLSVLLDKGLEMTEDGEELVNALKKTWPISKQFKKKPGDVKEEERVIKLDSYE